MPSNSPLSTPPGDDRSLCLAMIDTRPLGAGGSDLTPCKLPEGHDGPHEPMHPDAVKMLRLQAWLASRGIG